MLRELETAMNTMTAIIPMTNTMEETAFVPALCMICEEWCRIHHKDITEFIAMISELVTAVNSELGPYIC